MGSVRLLRAKLHQVRVTHCERDYVGSIAVDMDLMEQVGMLPLEEVDVVNLENGNRWSTYVLPAARGSLRVCPNGGGAMLCEPRDRLIIFSYALIAGAELRRGPHVARVLLADADNHPQALFEQILQQQEDGLSYRVRSVHGDVPIQPDLLLDTEPLSIEGP
ncbi:aspartate 1-decarboxylase [Mycobacterium sp. TY814]|uniref:aspartate 1-decarboxylase n=1 Tax=Mycobacterium sp. TY814 TaxID=3050580 RepID=UPI000F9982D7|nr:aspartate 1-decarboxylase [Mycobacterium sp. TY814]MDP7722429.1 aspartate 1-decarboxylase [Mycobacterium sp. TY814]RUP03825.1 MAG: aspartate 1-decarboxylase [Mycobacterium sp.]